MGNDRARVQRQAIEPASAARGAKADDSRVAGSPALLAQRKQMESAFGAAQLAAMPDEELQKKAPEEELQKKSPDEELPA